MSVKQWNCKIHCNPRDLTSLVTTRLTAKHLSGIAPVLLDLKVVGSGAGVDERSKFFVIINLPSTQELMAKSLAWAWLLHLVQDSMGALDWDIAWKL